MSKFNNTLKDSFEIFAKHPKFIIPKLVIALLYSIIILLTADIASTIFLEPDPELLYPILINSILLLGGTMFLSLLDLFIGSMYPFMVTQVKEKNQLNLGESFHKAMGKIRSTMPPLILIEILFLVVTVLLSIPLSFIIASEAEYFLLFSIMYAAILLGIVFLFYLIYPIVTLEKLSIVESLKKSIKISMSNRGAVGKATIMSFVLSGLSFGIAFLIEFFPGGEGSILFWLAFIIIRFLTAYVYSYLFVLNPVFYFNYAKAGK